MSKCDKHRTDLPCTLCAAKLPTWNELWKLHSEEPEQQQILVRGAILAYECNKVLACADLLIKAGARNDGREMIGYTAEMFMGIGDVLVQCALYACKIGLAPDEHLTSLQVEIPKTFLLQPTSTLQQTHQLAIQAGKVLRLVTYAHLNQDNVMRYDYYIAKSKEPLGEIVAICKKLCEKYGRDLQGILDIGKSGVRKRPVHQMLPIHGGMH